MTAACFFFFFGGAQEGTGVILGLGVLRIITPDAPRALSADVTQYKVLS